ncbi:MAG: carbon starvation protein A [Acidobacteriota bacterium]
MNASLAAIACIALYIIGYRYYGGHLARRVFRLDPARITPAHRLNDGLDYVPSSRAMLFGHHYASIAGLSPMLGPAIAVIWGWLPGMLWVVFGTLLIGAVHDFGCLVLSMRSNGESIGTLVERIIGPRARPLFLILIFFLVSVAMGLFVHVVSTLFSREFYPQAVMPTGSLMLIAVVMGLLIYKARKPLGWVTAGALAVMLLCVWAGLRVMGPDLAVGNWNLILLAYAFVASVLPVWLLLQPRDFINSLLLYLGLALMYAGFFLLRPQFDAPMIQTQAQGAPPFIPFVFITIACGAISGFHGLVSSGTTAKQINREQDAQFIGYGAMIGESLLGLIAVLACTAGFLSAEKWQQHYSQWQSGLAHNMRAFIDGTSLFINQVGIPMELAKAFVALVAVSFALTTLDSATRLLRYNLEEIAATAKQKWLGNRFVASFLAVLAIGFFAFFQVDGKPAGVILWVIFGTTNQVLGALSLLAITLYLMQRRAPYLWTLLPMVFMLVTTLYAMGSQVRGFIGKEQILLAVVGIGILALTVWLCVEAALRLIQMRRERRAEAARRPHSGQAAG